MGHIRLGLLPRTRAWKEVVGLIVAGADVSQVATATINAAEKAFSFVLNDEGYTEAVWLMTQLAIAAKQENYREHLAGIGVHLPDKATVADIATSLSDTLDRKLALGRQSDLAEIAQRALIGAVVSHLSPKLPSLFPADAADVHAALASLSRQKEFGELSRSFFARLTNESMGYFLSKTLATHMGEGQRFATMNQVAQFEDALQTHCREASVIVETFSSDWFSKHRFEEGGTISRESANGFASFALKKMKDELKAGARPDAA